MDAEKFLKWGSEYLSEYFYVFFCTLKNPTLQYTPTINAIESSSTTITHNAPSQSKVSINHKLFIFVIISIFIGATINSILPRRPTSPDIIFTFIITIAVWVVYSTSIFIVARLLKGKKSFLEVLSLILQLLAVIYVISNVSTYLISTISQTSFVNSIIRGKSNILDLYLDHPVFIYYVIQFILIFFYLPQAVKNMFTFGRIRQFIVNIVPIVGTSLAIFTFWGNVITPNRLNTVPPIPILPVTKPLTPISSLPSQALAPFVANNVATQAGDGQWNWTVFIQSSDDILDQVECAEYTLHPVLPNPVRIVCERGTGSAAFPLSATGWGTFEIQIRVFMKDGRVYELTHNLQF